MIWRSTTAYFNQGSEIARALIGSESNKKYFTQNDEDGEVGLKNNPNILFYEMNYLIEIYNKRYFSDIVDKFGNKITGVDIQFWDEKKYKFKSKQVEFDKIEKHIYSKIILSNNITTSIKKDDISKISPTIFEMLNQVYIPDSESKKIVDYYKAIFSLIFLCESTIINSNEFTFEFSKKEQAQFKITKDTNFDENIYFLIYMWVIKKCDKIVKVENLLKIVRELLSRKKFEDISIDVIEQLETAYNQAVSADIDKYFLSQEKLKNEFTTLTKLEFEDKRKLQYEILGLLVALSSSIYAIIDVKSIF